MSKADQFRQYAEEALRWARQSKTEKEKQAYTDLALTWMQAFRRQRQCARSSGLCKARLSGGLPSFQHVVLIRCGSPFW
jgi:hypothetical protein